MIHDHMPRFSRRPPCLTFSPLAWLKLQYFCHAGNTEIAGFAISAKDDPLYVEEFLTVRQRTSPVTVALDDQAVADYLDHCVDAGLPPQRALRIWIHTHPGDSAEPSSTDEETFARVFGSCDWAVMCIVSRRGDTYARLSLRVGPGAEVMLPVRVDWSDWPAVLSVPALAIADPFAHWRQEFADHVQRLGEPQRPVLLPFDPLLEAPRPVAPVTDAWAMDDFNQYFWEDFQTDERVHDIELSA
jgi:proteasome lid subunit RPN8/RPN11